MNIKSDERLTQKELAKRIGASESSFKRNKDQILLELSNHLEYEVEYKGRATIYHILEVYDEDYMYQRKNQKQLEERDRIFKASITETVQEQDVNTARNVGRILNKEWPEVKDLGYTENTTYEYVRTRMREWFGYKVEDANAFDRLDKDSKRLGYIKDKIWCHLDEKNLVYIPLEQEQIEYFYEALGDASEYKQMVVDIINDYEADLYTEEDMIAALKEFKNNKYAAAKKMFKNKYGYYPIKVPQYVLFER